MNLPPKSLKLWQGAPVFKGGKVKQKHRKIGDGKRFIACKVFNKSLTKNFRCYATFQKVKAERMLES